MNKFNELVKENRRLKQEIKRYDEAFERMVNEICDLEGKINNLQQELNELKYNNDEDY